MNGLVLYEGKSEIGDRNIVVLATLKSRNRKTGNMIQIYILRSDISPSEAARSLDNQDACGYCMLQGVIDEETGELKWRVCYVIPEHGATEAWQSWRNGGYERYDRKRHEGLIRGRKVRWGAFGDPAAVPVKLVEYVCKLSSGWTGYTHQAFWINRQKANRLAKYLMVSCHTPAQYAESQRRGWRAFYTLPKGAAAPEGAVACPFFTRGVLCIQCRLCCGAERNAKNIYSPAHGVGSSNLARIQALQGNTL